MTMRPGRLCLLIALAALFAFGPRAEATTFRWANDGDPTTMDPHARSDRSDDVAL